MMQADLASRYQRARAVAVPSAPGPEALQALWLEQFLRQPLRDSEGDAWTVAQPGVPEAPGAPRWVEAALRRGEETRVGSVTVGRAGPEIDLCAVVWEPGSVRGRHIALCDQLAAPWPELAELIDLPAPVLAEEGAETPLPLRLEMVRAAGLYRLRRKARRLELRRQAAGLRQLLWEELAGALGFHKNQAPFRHLARRLPAVYLEPMEEEDRMALLFGVAGLLPASNLAVLPERARRAARPLWDRWWKARAALDYAVLPASSWSRGPIRPANRPERRLAALARLLPHLPRLERAVERRDAAAFARVCGEAYDPFWSHHAAWRGKTALKPLLLVGAERVDDLVHSLFWPLAAGTDFGAAAAALEALPAGESRAARETRTALLGEAVEGRSLRGALFQQGLLELWRDAATAGALRGLAARYARLESEAGSSQGKRSG